MDYAIQLVNIIIILAIFTIGSMFLMKKLKKGKFKKISEHNKMQIVDGLQIGMGQNVYLLKVNGENILLATNSTAINMINLGKGEIENPKESFEQKLDEMVKYEKPELSLKGLAKTVGEKIKNEK